MFLASRFAAAALLLARLAPCAAAAENIGEELTALRLAAAAVDASQPENARKIEAAYRALLARHPRNPEAANATAAFLWENHAPQEALQLWEKTLAQRSA